MLLRLPIVFKDKNEDAVDNYEMSLLTSLSTDNKEPVKEKQEYVYIDMSKIESFKPNSTHITLTTISGDKHEIAIDERAFMMMYQDLTSTIIKNVDYGRFDDEEDEKKDDEEYF